MCTQNRLLGLIILLLGISCQQFVPYESKNFSLHVPNNIFPPNDTTDIQVATSFLWTSSNPGAENSILYDFYLKANDPESELMASGITDTSFHINSLHYNTRYYWKIIARDQTGHSSSSPVWSFVTRYENNSAPYFPSNPLPKEGTTVSIENSTLTWYGGDPDSFSIVTYDVYFGKQADSMKLFSEHQPDTVCTIGILEFNTQYYWRIVAKDHYGLVAEGPMWSFSTEQAQLCFEENFDSYPTDGYPEIPIWTINKSGASLFITDIIGWNNQGKSVCFIDSTDTGSCFLAKRLPAKSSGMLQFCWRITTHDDVFGLRFYSKEANTAHLGPQLSIREGKLQFYDSTYNWQTVCEVDLNSWYSIQLLFDCHQKYYKIFVNGHLLVEHATWIGSSVSGLDLIYFLTFDNRLCWRAYLDEMKLLSGK